MKRRDEGHPLAAMLVLSSMFAFAFVFHVVTQPGAQVAARYDRQLAAFAVPAVFDVPAASELPSVGPAQVIAATASPIVFIATAVEPVMVAPAPPPLLDAFAWTTMPAAFPAAASASVPGDGLRDGGAVTRAFATTSSALRSAFRKTF